MWPTSAFPNSTLIASILLTFGGTCGPTASLESASLRFILEAPSGGASPVFVLLASSNDQPGWVSITDESGARVDIRPRCDIADCDMPPAVCGAGIPVIRDIAAGRIEVEWDGMMSVIDPMRACETRRPAPPGRYVATFCHARQASFVGEGDTKVGVQGSLVHPTCARVPFTWPGADTVQYRVPTGDSR